MAVEAQHIIHEAKITEHEPTAAEQKEAREKLTTPLSSHLVYETVAQNLPITLDRAYTPTSMELAALVLTNRKGENLNWQRLTTESQQARANRWAQEKQKAAYQNKTEQEKDDIAEAAWVRSNVSWIAESRQNADPATRVHLLAALRAVGITEPTNETTLTANLKTFLNKYGDEQTGPQQYVEAIANSCKKTDGSFDYVKFLARKNALKDFTAGNFGDTKQVEQLFDGYMDAFVTLEYTLRNQAYQADALAAFQKELQHGEPKKAAPEAEKRNRNIDAAGESLGYSVPNEDALIVRADKGVFGVFDGMGGHSDGEIASETAKNYVEQELTKIADDLSVDETKQAIARILRGASGVVRTKANGNGMGCTASVVKLLQNGTAVIGNVGDSRVYVLRNGATVAEPVTLDDGRLREKYDEKSALAKQKLIGQAKRQEDLSDDELKEYLYRAGPYAIRAGGISQAVGDAHIEPRLYSIQLSPGDKLIIDSDGIHDNLTDGEIAECLNANPKDSQKAAKALIHKAKQVSELFNKEDAYGNDIAPRAKKDDLTAIVISLENLAQQLNPIHIRQELERPSKLSDLPAVRILANQLDKNQANILEKVPNAPRHRIAFILAGRFFNMTPYQRISESAVFGPKAYERFDDPRQLEPLMPEIRKGIIEAEQKIATNRPTARINKENGWLYVDQGKHKTDYRIYLSPNPTQIGKIFADLALTIPEAVRYQMKTFDNPTTATDASRLDKIILYCPEADFDTILAAVGKVYQQNQASFQERPAPGGGTISPAEGMSITKQPKEDSNGEQVTGTEQIANTIEHALDVRLSQITKDRLGKFKDARAANQSDEAKLLWSVLKQDGESLAGYWYAGRELLTKDLQNALTNAYLDSLRQAMLYNYVEKKPLSMSQIKQTFLNALPGQVRLSPSQLQYLQQHDLIDTILEIQQRIAQVTMKTGLAIAFDEGFAKRQKPGAILKKILSA